eukprot:jgi/Botrbrau1/11229/Bobra.0038s0001.1
MTAAQLLAEQASFVKLGVYGDGNCLVASMVCGEIMVGGDAPPRTWLEIADPNELLGTVVVRARCALSDLARDMPVEVWCMGRLTCPTSSFLDRETTMMWCCQWIPFSLCRWRS